MNADERALMRAVRLLQKAPADERRWVVDAMPITEQRTLEEFWPGWAHEGSFPLLPTGLATLRPAPEHRVPRRG